MMNAIQFSYNKHLWVKFFTVKILEYILLWIMIGVHLYSLAYGDEFSWMFLIIGTEIGYFIIISVLLFVGLFKIRISQQIHGLLNFIGCALFILAGIRILYVHKVYSDSFHNTFVKYWPYLDFLHSDNSKKYEAVTKKFKFFLPMSVNNDNIINQLKQTFKLGYVRGGLNLAEGVVLLVDSFLVFKENC